MYLGSSSLPIKIPVKGALKKVETSLKDKDWNDFELGSMKLTLIPFFCFNYHYYIEKDNAVHETVDGKSSLNGVSLKIEDFSKLIDSNTLVNESPKIEFEEKKSFLTKKTKEEVIKVKIAEMFKISKETVVVSSIKKVFVPLYETFITIKKETYNVKINAVNGELIGVDKVPKREKGFLEITKETLIDLQDPKKWKEYVMGLGKEIRVFIKKREESNSPSILSIFSHKIVIFALIIVALFLIFISLI